MAATYSNIIKYRRNIPSELYKTVRHAEACVLSEGADRKVFEVAVVCEANLFFIKMRDYSQSAGKLRPISYADIIKITYREDETHSMFKDEKLSQNTHHIDIEIMEEEELVVFDFAVFEENSMLLYHLHAAWINFMFRYTLGIRPKTVELLDESQARQLYIDFEQEYQYIEAEYLKDKIMLLTELSLTSLQDRTIKRGFFDVSMHRRPGIKPLFTVLIQELANLFTPQEHRTDRELELEFILAVFSLLHSMLFNSEALPSRIHTILNPEPYTFAELFSIISADFSAESIKMERDLIREESAAQKQGPNNGFEESKNGRDILGNDSDVDHYDAFGVGHGFQTPGRGRMRARPEKGVGPRYRSQSEFERDVELDLRRMSPTRRQVQNSDFGVSATLERVRKKERELRPAGDKKREILGEFDWDFEELEGQDRDSPKTIKEQLQAMLMSPREVSSSSPYIGNDDEEVDDDHGVLMAVTDIQVGVVNLIGHTITHGIESCVGREYCKETLPEILEKNIPFIDFRLPIYVRRMVALITHKDSADVAARLFEYVSLIHKLATHSLAIKAKIMQHSKEEIEYYLSQKHFLLRLDYSIFFNLQSLELLHSLVVTCLGTSSWTVDEIIQSSKIKQYRKMAKRRGSVADTIMTTQRARRGGGKRHSLFSHEAMPVTATGSRASLERLKEFHEGAEKTFKRPKNALGLTEEQVAQLRQATFEMKGPQGSQSSRRRNLPNVGVPTSTRRARRRRSLFQNTAAEEVLEEQPSFSTRTIHRRSFVGGLESFRLPDDLLGRELIVQDDHDEEHSPLPASKPKLLNSSQRDGEESISFSLNAAESSRSQRRGHPGVSFRVLNQGSVKWGSGSGGGGSSKSRRRGRGQDVIGLNRKRSGYMNDYKAAKLATELAAAKDARSKREKRR